ncbi:MAG: phosphomannomutase/phosphoglucomutase [Alphaproteobacteria bacterium]|nr:phosphomannomutase/phosphoglucomutase [Alphaproteobacteria bacterium]
MTVSAARTSAPHRFHPTILREYDIRGIVGETLSEEDAYYIGLGFGTFILNNNPNATKVCVGYDGRVSSPMLEAAVAKGIMETGLTALRIGLGPTPMLYFAVRDLPADGGIMITGSHNPPTHNGFKAMQAKAALFGTDIKKLGEYVESGNVIRRSGGKSQDVSVKEKYLEALLGAYRGEKLLTIAWDAGNGAAGEIMEQLCQRLPGKHVALFGDIDGTFPNHHPDPSVAKNLQDLIATVAQEKCDLGVAFDGDGDRVGVVDDEGQILWGDQLMALLSEDVLKDIPGATIIADVKASQTLFDGIAAKGGKPLMWKTGHSLIKAKMAETGAPLAGEMSGHIFFADRYYGFDDGLYGAVRVIDIVSRSGLKLSDWRKKLPATIATPELRIPCPEDRKFAVIDETKQRLTAAKADMETIDGVRVNTGSGWWLLRASNTGAQLVARCEAKDAASLKTAEAQLLEQLRLSGVEFKTEAH